MPHGREWPHKAMANKELLTLIYDDNYPLIPKYRPRYLILTDLHVDIAVPVASQEPMVAPISYEPTSWP
jgi:hypothetical protein